MSTKSNQQMKTEWLEALRSGKYPQVQGTLKGLTEDGKEGYCCLGVFCSVVLGEEPELCVEDEDLVLYEGPSETYIKITNIIGWVEAKGIDMNDNGEEFSTIADMIEEEWEV